MYILDISNSIYRFEGAKMQCMHQWFNKNKILKIYFNLHTFQKTLTFLIIQQLHMCGSNRIEIRYSADCTYTGCIPIFTISAKTIQLRALQIFGIGSEYWNAPKVTFSFLSICIDSPNLITNIISVIRPIPFLLHNTLAEMLIFKSD